MSHPLRIQRRRTKGFHLPAGTIVVTRGTKWGNPFPADQCGGLMASKAMYRAWMAGRLNHRQAPPTLDEIRRELGGRTLACYCSINAEWCHGNDLVALAAGEPLR